MNARRTALALIIAKHQGNLDAAAEAFITFCDDDAAISSPSLIEALDTFLMTDTYTVEITQTLEFVDEFSHELARRIAEHAELCPTHLSDPENCADELH
jgi:hypothetical protein